MADTPTSDAAKAEEILGKLEQAVKNIEETPGAPSPEQAIDLNIIIRRAKEAISKMERIAEGVKQQTQTIDTESRIAQIKSEAGL